MTRVLGTMSSLLGALLLAPLAVPAQQGPEFDDEVLEITAGVLDRFLTAADAEAKERNRGLAGDPRLAEAARRSACLERHRPSLDAAWELPDEQAEAQYRRTVDLMWSECAPGERPGADEAGDVEAWSTCTAGFEEKAQVHVDDYAAAYGRGDMPAVRRHLAAIDRLREEAEAACGAAPDGYDDWDDEGAMQEPPDPFFDDPDLQDVLWAIEIAAEETAARAGGFTARQYGVVRERALAFLLRSIEDNRLHRYLFAPTEIRVLDRNRAGLDRALRALDLIDT